MKSSMAMEVFKFALGLMWTVTRFRVKAIARFALSLIRNRRLSSAKNSYENAILLGNIVVVSRMISFKTPAGDTLEQVILRLNRVLTEPLTVKQVPAKPKKKRKAKK